MRFGHICISIVLYSVPGTYLHICSSSTYISTYEYRTAARGNREKLWDLKTPFSEECSIQLRRKVRWTKWKTIYAIYYSVMNISIFFSDDAWHYLVRHRYKRTKKREGTLYLPISLFRKTMWHSSESERTLFGPYRTGTSARRFRFHPDGTARTPFPSLRNTTQGKARRRNDFIHYFVLP